MYVEGTSGLRLAGLQGFSIDSSDIVFHGICAPCSTSAADGGDDTTVEPDPTIKPTINPTIMQNGSDVMTLQGTKTHENLKEAFAGESQANRRYLWFAQKADVEGYPDAVMPASAPLRRARRVMPTRIFEVPRRSATVTGEPIGETADNFKASIAGETYEYTQQTRLRQVGAGRGASTRSPTGSRPWLG